MTFSNANIITPKTRRILELTNAMLEEPEVTIAEEVPKNIVEASPDKILLKEAIASRKFSYQGFGIYKEADTSNSIGKVWIKKEVIDEVTGEKQEWLIAYTNEEEDFARSLATKKLNGKKVLSGAGAQDLITEVEASGKKISEYSVETSPAVLYSYKGNKYEIVTWKDATEHPSGEKQISNFGALQKQSYDDAFDVGELRREQSEIDNKIKDLDMPELEESTDNPFDVASSDAEVFDGSGTVIQMGSIVQNEFGKEGKVADILSPTKVTVSWFDRNYTEGERGDTIYPGDIKVIGRMIKKAGEGDYEDQGGDMANQDYYEEQLYKQPEKFKTCTECDGEGEDIRGNKCEDCKGTGYVKKGKYSNVREFEMSASNEKGDYCVICKNSNKFSGECGSITSAKSFNDPELHDTVEFDTVENATHWFDTKMAELGLATDKFHKRSNPYDIAQEFAQILEPNSETGHKLSKVAGRGIYAMHPATMKGYEEPLPELNIDDLVVDTRTNKSGLVKQIEGDAVDVLVDGSYTMSVPIKNVKKVSYQQVLGEPTRDNIFKYLDGKSGKYYEPVNISMLIKDVSRYFNISPELANEFLQEYKSQKTAGQPKPEDIPIAPGIKSKNITLDESGGQGSAKVTIDFTNVEQGLKFYQEQVTEAPPAPKEEPVAATPATIPAQQSEAKPAGPPIPISSSLKFSYVGEKN